MGGDSCCAGQLHAIKPSNLAGVVVIITCLGSPDSRSQSCVGPVYGIKEVAYDSDDVSRLNLVLVPVDVGHDEYYDYSLTYQSPENRILCCARSDT